jgi:hypothetical protein
MVVAAFQFEGHSHSHSHSDAMLTPSSFSKSWTPILASGPSSIVFMKMSQKRLPTRS